MTDNTKRTASIDLAQLIEEIDEVLSGATLNIGRQQRLLKQSREVLARRSLTSGAPAEPVAEKWAIYYDNLGEQPYESRFMAGWDLYGSEDAAKRVTSSWTHAKHYKPVKVLVYVAPVHYAAAPSPAPASIIITPEGMTMPDGSVFHSDGTITGPMAEVLAPMILQVAERLRANAAPSAEQDEKILFAAALREYNRHADDGIVGMRWDRAEGHVWRAARALSTGAAAKTEQTALEECAVCDGQGCTHYPDGEWEGKCDACEGTGIDQSRAPAAGAGIAQPHAEGCGRILSKADIDEIVYKCRQSGKDTTYDIVNAAIRAALTQQAGSAQPGAEGDERALTAQDLDVLRFAAEVLDGLEYEDTAGDLRGITRRGDFKEIAWEKF